MGAIDIYDISSETIYSSSAVNEASKYIPNLVTLSEILRCFSDANIYDQTMMINLVMVISHTPEYKIGNHELKKTLEVLSK